MTTPEKREPPALVTHLFELVARDDRAALSRLRRGLGKPPGTDVASFQDVVPYIPEKDEAPSRAWPYFVVAALFASYPVQGSNGTTVANAFASLPETAARDGRFRALLNTHVADLPSHLRQAVGLIGSKDLTFCWARLLGDLRGWSHPDHSVQRRWARDFWGKD